MIQPMELHPTVLVGDSIQLEPLKLDHLPELTVAARHPEIWTYLDEETPTDEGVASLVAEALGEQQQGMRLPYAILDRITNTVIGSISYIDIQRKHRGVEIGWAWIAPKYWGKSSANEASLLLMTYAFNQEAIRVAFKTDSRNLRSQRAIERLGAKREGVFRNHRILRDGHIRHSVYYSVTREDWLSRS